MTTVTKRQAERELYEWVRLLVCTVLALVLLFTFVVRLIRVDGESMRETLQDGDMLLALSGWLCGDYAPGDIVVLSKAGFENGAPVVKRVVAVEGQTVHIDFNEGAVYVDGEALAEPYVREPTWTPEGVDFPVTLGENEIFVLGDNRNDSKDSRHPDLGAVDSRCVIGRAVFLTLPGVSGDTGRREWSRIGLLN